LQSRPQNQRDAIQPAPSRESYPPKRAVVNSFPDAVDVLSVATIPSDFLGEIELPKIKTRTPINLLYRGFFYPRLGIKMYDSLRKHKTDVSGQTRFMERLIVDSSNATIIGQRLISRARSPLFWSACLPLIKALCFLIMCGK
jgi:hypothetical protein